GGGRRARGRRDHALADAGARESRGRSGATARAEGPHLRTARRAARRAFARGPRGQSGQERRVMSLRLAVLGLSLSSSWGNGHATTYRALLRAFAARGHDITFLERDQPWY